MPEGQERELLSALLARRRRELGLSEAQLAELMHELATAARGRGDPAPPCEVSADGVWQWEHAEHPVHGRIPRPYNRHWLAEALELPVSRINRACAASKAERARRRNGGGGATLGEGTAEGTAGEEAAVNRGQFLQLAAAAGAAVATATTGLGAPAAVQARELSRRAGASTVDAATLDALRRAAARYGVEFFARPLGELRPAVVAARADVGELLGGKLRLDHHRELVVLAGLLSYLLAGLDWDLGDREAAHAWCDDVLARGQEAGHGELVARSFEQRALMAFYEGRPREAAACAQAGQRHAPAGTPVRAQLAGQELRAWARLGRTYEREARDALARLEASASSLPAGSAAAGRFGFDPAGLPYFTATAWVLLGRPELAEPHARQVLALADPEEQGTRSALARIDLALALAAQGRVDEACALGVQALAGPRLVGSVLARARELDAALGGHASDRRVRAFRDRYAHARRSLPLPGA